MHEGKMAGPSAVGVVGGRGGMEHRDRETQDTGWRIGGCKMRVESVCLCLCGWGGGGRRLLQRKLLSWRLLKSPSQTRGDSSSREGNWEEEFHRKVAKGV